MFRVIASPRRSESDDEERGTKGIIRTEDVGHRSNGGRQETEPLLKHGFLPINILILKHGFCVRKEEEKEKEKRKKKKEKKRKEKKKKRAKEQKSKRGKEEQRETEVKKR